MGSRSGNVGTQNRSNGQEGDPRRMVGHDAIIEAFRRVAPEIRTCSRGGTPPKYTHVHGPRQNRIPGAARATGSSSTSKPAPCISAGSSQHGYPQVLARRSRSTSIRWVIPLGRALVISRMASISRPSRMDGTRSTTLRVK